MSLNLNIPRRRNKLLSYLTNCFPDGDFLAVFLFGSYAKGKASKNSDIDLFVLGHSGNLLASVDRQKRFYGKSLHIIFEPLCILAIEVQRERIAHHKMFEDYSYLLEPSTKVLAGGEVGSQFQTLLRASRDDQASQNRSIIG